MIKERVRLSKLIGWNIYTIIFVLIYFFCAVGISYAYYAFSYEEESVIVGNVINVDMDLEVELVVGTNEEMVPLLDDALFNAINGVGSPNGACIDSLNNLSCQVYKITLTNNGSRVKHITGTVELYAKDGTDNVYNNLKWMELSDPTTLKNEIKAKTMSKSTLVSRLTLESKEEKVWYIAVWISEINGDQRASDKGDFGGTVTFEVVEPTFNTGNVIIDSIMGPEAETDSFIDFSQTSASSGTNGIYMRHGTDDDEYPIYYYRGQVDNNLIFADYCFKIVRTTETGGLKLIYNGVPTDGQCNNTGEASQIGISQFNSRYKSPAYGGYMYSSLYEFGYKSMDTRTDTYVYGNDVKYENGKYILVDTITSNDWSSIYENGLVNYHYSCFSTSDTCDSVYYIYNTTYNVAYNVPLTEGKKIEDVLVEMLGSDTDNPENYNTISSTIKGDNQTEGTIDYWYYTNIEQKGYSNYIEDTVWCNDRRINSLGGWESDGGATYIDDSNSSALLFAGYQRIQKGTPSLSCREIDKFTVDESNGNGDLDYPIGLLTSDEAMLAGMSDESNENYYLYTGKFYWFGTPGFYNYFYMYQSRLDVQGNFKDLNVDYVSESGPGVRPSISLRSGFTMSGGDGTASNPYIILTD